MTLKVRLNELAKRCYHPDGRLNRWGLLFAAYFAVFNIMIYKWILIRLWHWLVR